MLGTLSAKTNTTIVSYLLRTQRLAEVEAIPVQSPIQRELADQQDLSADVHDAAIPCAAAVF